MSYTAALMCELPVIPGAFAAVFAAAFLFLLLCAVAAARAGEAGTGAALISGMAAALVAAACLESAAMARACW